ncbi:MAG TPA: metallophosphoesterase family protein, partial [Balneolaceae bacterium]|nr:metallophosphoesterase family protein [Balneolaceae bacterium]
MAHQKYIAIGDIHGCYQSLEALLKKLEPFADRQFIFIGDYIDRGPDSKKVVERLMEFQQQADCVFLRGNHEQMLLDAFNDGEFKLWISNGGKATLKSYGIDRFGRLPDAHFDFYDQTKFYYETNEYFFVHAGLSAAKTIKESLQDEEEIEAFLWERSHLNAFETPWEKKVVFGHTPRPQPIRKNGMIGIDTGCVFKRMGYGKLTAVKLPEEEF